MTVPLPWQEGLWQELQDRIRGQNLPHALLFCGNHGYGKAIFARNLAQSLLCQSPTDTGAPCGHCHACGLLAAGTHPDLRIIEPAEEGKAILIDTIRGVAEFFALKGHYGGRQVVIIQPAEAMNRFAANSLLKTLEEPTPDALLILVTSRPSLLLPTIRSRCQRVVFPRPDTSAGLAWLTEHTPAGTDVTTLLALADGAPLEALELFENGSLEARYNLADQWLQVISGRGDPLKCAANWSQLGLVRAVNWLSSWTMDLIRLKSGAAPDVITNSDLRPQLQNLAQRLDLRRLFGQLEQLTEYSRMAGSNLNVQLALEDVMISWSRRS